MNSNFEFTPFPVENLQDIKQKVLKWMQSFSTFCCLDNNGYTISPQIEETLFAVGAKRSIKLSAGNAVEQLQQFYDANPSWLFGHFSYDLKNEIEELDSQNEDGIQFPDLFFFEPEILIRLNKTEIQILAADAKNVYAQIIATKTEPLQTPQSISLKNKLSKEDYLAAANALLKHIQKGDCYEINFCQEFYAEEAPISPLLVYKNLSKLSPAPFSSFYRVEDKYLFCASPERYLMKKENMLLSQPIKGTAPRYLADKEKDLASSQSLYNNKKERSENVMIVDLVRNDFSKVCEKKSVEVHELFGIYSFPQVHQMISTVKGILRNETKFRDIIRATFPMGSMTGAPKKRVMELIEQYEKTKRGIFSGAVGYITPNGDFDFNVVIRSIMYNATNQFVSMQAGSAITFYSEPEKEWNECLLKMEALKKVIENTI